MEEAIKAKDAKVEKLHLALKTLNNRWSQEEAIIIKLLEAPTSTTTIYLLLKLALQEKAVKLVDKVKIEMVQRDLLTMTFTAEKAKRDSKINMVKEQIQAMVAIQAMPAAIELAYTPLVEPKFEVVIQEDPK